MTERLSESAEETRALGRALGQDLPPGSVILLFGALGTGKTTFVQGIAEGLGVTEPVTSPTFTLVHEYGQGEGKLIHMDPFRLDSEDDLVGIGFDDYLQRGDTVVIEWGERLGGLTPRDRLEVHIETLNGDRRRIRLEARGEMYKSLLERMSPC